jgi:ribose/xylose/arabinose/galactoside ABC-type transport system permease subunit
MSSQSTAGDASPTSLFERIFRTYHAAGLLPILLPVLLVAFALFVPNFIAVQNLLNVLRSSSYLVIIAAGQMLVLIVGGFDLSQGAVVALSCVTSALVMVAFKGTFANEPGLIILVGVLAETMTPHPRPSP